MLLSFRIAWNELLIMVERLDYKVSLNIVWTIESIQYDTRIKVSKATWGKRERERERERGGGGERERKGEGRGSEGGKKGWYSRFRIFNFVVVSTSESDVAWQMRRKLALNFLVVRFGTVVSSKLRNIINAELRKTRGAQCLDFVPFRTENKSKWSMSSRDCFPTIFCL